MMLDMQHACHNDTVRKNRAFVAAMSLSLSYSMNLYRGQVM